MADDFTVGLKRFSLEMRRDAAQLALSTLQLVKEGLPIDTAIEMYADNVDKTNSELAALGPEKEKSDGE